MELDVLAHSHSVLREHLQRINKQKEIELYYELLSSGHSVGEILHSLGSIQRESEHGNVATTEHSSSGFDRIAPVVTSQDVLMSAVQASTSRTSALTSPLEVENYRTEESRITDSTVLDALGSGKWKRLSDENSPEPAPDITRSPALHPSNSGEIEASSSDQEASQADRFSNSAKRIAFGAFYTIAVASVSIVSYAIISGGRNVDSAFTHIQSDVSSGTEAVPIPGLEAGRSETVMEISQSNKELVNTGTSRAPQPSRAVEPSSAVSNPPQRDTTEMPATFSAGAAHVEQAAESGRRLHAPAINYPGTAALETVGFRNAPKPTAKEIVGEQIVRAFYTALENGDGKAASSLVIPEKREAGPFSASELSRFYGRLELPFRLIGVYRAGENLYNVSYNYKVRNGRFCNGRSLVTTMSLQDQVLIEKIQSPSRC